MDLGLHGKKVMVTGASKGIGLAIARSFAAEGCSIRLVARDEKTLAYEASGIAREFGVAVNFYAVDLKDPASFSVLADRAGDIDILVNNAGDVPPGPIDAFDVVRMASVWQLKVFGYIGLMNAFYPLMTARRHGVILNVMGTAGYRVDAKLVALAGANASLIATTRALGAAAPEHGVRVVGVNPGATLTDRVISVLQMQAEQRFGSAERWQDMQATLPFGRAARPDEVADVVVFMASNRASYVSGAIVNVDGGKCELP